MRKTGLCCDSPRHPVFSRRTLIQAGTIGLMGLGSEHVGAWRAWASDRSRFNGQDPPARSVIYIFLSGGLSQIDSFDMKPGAQDDIRGEFKPISTATPGIQICEHLPLLAQRSPMWSLVRSLTHPSNDHSLGHHIMLTGRSDMPPGFDPAAPRPGDHPTIAAVAGALTKTRNSLASSVVLPEKLVHYSGRVIPGQFAGAMGKLHDPLFIETSRYEPGAYGAYPQYEFDHQERPFTPKRNRFEFLNLSLSQNVSLGRFANRLAIMQSIDRQRRELQGLGEVSRLDHFRKRAIALLTSPQVKDALDVSKADPRALERYGDNAFGWSLLMAKRLVEAGVSLVQVNLGNNETWDTHGNAFPHLKNNLFPPTDRALSALLDDLHQNGMLENTLVVMAGEFGRTPRISHLPQYYKLPGRDHWGASQTVFYAGGGVQGGRVVGKTDHIGAFPVEDPQTPENMAATIYHALGIPSDAEWLDEQGRPQAVYRKEPITGLA